MFDVNYLMSMSVDGSPGTVWALNIAAKRKDFSERDRLMMNLIRPHFDQAHHNAQRASAWLDARAKPLAAYELTPREVEIAHWLANGKTNPEVAIILQISARTVEKHMEKILEKLGVENRTTAAVVVANAIGVNAWVVSR